MVTVVPGEEELGPQRFCRRCHEWWPIDPEFWATHSGLRNVCRACDNDSRTRKRTARRSRRIAELEHAAAERRREYWRERQQRWRDRVKAGDRAE